MSDSESFRADLVRPDDEILPIRCVGFRAGHAEGGTPFVSVQLGAAHSGTFTLLLEPAEARTLAVALVQAADFADAGNNVVTLPRTGR